MSGPSATGELERRALVLEYFTIAWNVIEALVALVAGWLAGSIALVGFGLDSLIEVTSAVALVWRLRMTGDPDAELEAERRALRIVGYTLFALAAYVTLQAGSILLRRASPEESFVGIALAAVSLIVMPWLGFAKKKLAKRLGSRALDADATETLVCSYLSLTLLAGLGANALWGWWWADPVAALTIVAFVLHEGKEALEHSRDAG
ncbi:MAG TPA: cation transporter [Vicinamibacteria bacterium]|nr:cation transporter [Vicinamibacteria bacterium]